MGRSGNRQAASNAPRRSTASWNAARRAANSGGKQTAASQSPDCTARRAAARPLAGPPSGRRGRMSSFSNSASCESPGNSRRSKPAASASGGSPASRGISTASTLLGWARRNWTTCERLIPNRGYNNSGRTKIINSVRRSRSWSRISRNRIRRTLRRFMPDGPRRAEKSIERRVLRGPADGAAPAGPPTSPRRESVRGAGSPGGRRASRPRA